MAKIQLPAFHTAISLLMTSYLTTVTCQTQDAQSSCCSANLMDSGNRVIIDTTLRRSGNYNAIKLLMCTTSKTYVQIWDQDTNDENSYTLYRQFEVNPTYLSEYLIAFDSMTPITTSMRVGFFSPGADKHSVPYRFDPKLYDTVISTQTYSSSKIFNLNEGINMDSVAWPRSFKMNFRLCKEIDCSDEDESLLPIVVPGPPGPKGDKGDKGDQGEPCDPFSNPSMDQIGGINDQVNDIKSDTQRLTDLISEVGNKVDELSKGNFVTGTCPVGFLPGSYGVGSCYYIFRRERRQFGEGLMECVALGGNLVDIFSELENDFLTNEITKLIAESGNGKPEEFWTSGMYSDDISQWAWYDEVKSTRITLLYENWYSELARSPEDGFKPCLKMVVDPDTNRSYWMAEVCEKRLYHICKVDKKCM